MIIIDKKYFASVIDDIIALINTRDDKTSIEILDILARYDSIKQSQSQDYFDDGLSNLMSVDQ